MKKSILSYLVVVLVSLVGFIHCSGNFSSELSGEDNEFGSGDNINNFTEIRPSPPQRERKLIENFQLESENEDNLLSNETSLETVLSSLLPKELSDEIEEILLSESDGIRKLAITYLLKIFGISELSVQLKENKNFGPAPEFMIDLYNTITDSYGITVARNPFDAHIVRSYSEKDNSVHDYFSFNITNIGESEKILEAEFHVHRSRIPHESLHPSLYITPFYILSLYQVLDPNYLHVPDLHKLLSVTYVPALGSGWEVFNVTTAVLDWLNDIRPNHGFLLAATSLSDERVPVHFSRRGETSHAKQPILVLFNEDSNASKFNPPKTNFKSSGKDKEYDIKINSSTTTNHNATSSQELDSEIPESPASSLENPRFHHALLYKDSIRHPNSVSRFRNRRSKKNQTEPASISNSSSSGIPCTKKDLFVSFEAIGWSSWIISPKGYNGFFCDGQCRFPLGQQSNPTNHATIQSIVHELKLSDTVQLPCCVPTKLLPISLLYYDDHDNVVLKQYVDMVAESCGCH